MAKNDRSKGQASQRVPQPTLNRTTRIGISLLLLLHLVIVVATPAGLVMPGSQFARRLLQGAAPYVQAGNVSHG